MFITLTNASEAHRGNKVAVKISEIISVYNSTVTKEDGKSETLTLVYAPPHGTWEVTEKLENIVSELNTYGKSKK
jgi:hypothetical protein